MTAGWLPLVYALSPPLYGVLAIFTLIALIVAYEVVAYAHPDKFATITRTL